MEDTLHSCFQSETFNERYLFTTNLTMCVTESIDRFRGNGVTVSFEPADLLSAFRSPTLNSQYLVNAQSADQLVSAIEINRRINPIGSPLVVDMKSIAILRLKVAHAYATAPGHTFAIYANDRPEWNCTHYKTPGNATPSQPSAVNDAIKHAMALVSTSPIQANSDYVVFDRRDSVHHPYFKTYGPASFQTFKSKDVRDLPNHPAVNEVYTNSPLVSLLNQSTSPNMVAHQSPTTDNHMTFLSAGVTPMLNEIQKAVDNIRHGLGIYDLSKNGLKFGIRWLSGDEPSTASITSSSSSSSSDTLRSPPMGDTRSIASIPSNPLPSQPTSTSTTPLTTTKRPQQQQQRVTVYVKLEFEYTFPQTSDHRYVFA